jgi:hypothetical protein
VSEVRISIRRLGEFLQLPEPPAPVHAQQQRRQQGPKAGGLGADGASLAADIVVSVDGEDFDWDDRSWVAAAAAGKVFALRSKSAKHSEEQRATKAAAVGTAKAQQLQVEIHSQQAAAGRAGSPAAASAAGGLAVDALKAAASTHPTLKQLDFQAHRGQLVAIVGEVGSGKSSVLAALLGELQPIRRKPGASGGPDAPENGEAGPAGGSSSGDGGMVVRGRVAYCSQVPWIVSGSFKVGAQASWSRMRLCTEGELAVCRGCHGCWQKDVYGG